MIIASYVLDCLCPHAIMSRRVASDAAASASVRSDCACVEVIYGRFFEISHTNVRVGSCALCIT